jgi:hypothetical protein
MRPQDRQAGGAKTPTPQSDRVSTDRRQRRLTRPCRLPSVEAVDVPEQVVCMLDALEDLTALLRPHDRFLIVGVQCRGEFHEVLVDLGPLPKIERRPPDVVDRSQRSHGSSSVCELLRRSARQRRSRCSGDAGGGLLQGFDHDPSVQSARRWRPNRRHPIQSTPPAPPPESLARHAEPAHRTICAESISNRCRGGWGVGAGQRARAADQAPGGSGRGWRWEGSEGSFVCRVRRPSAVRRAGTGGRRRPTQTQSGSSGPRCSRRNASSSAAMSP